MPKTLDDLKHDRAVKAAQVIGAMKGVLPSLCAGTAKLVTDLLAEYEAADKAIADRLNTDAADIATKGLDRWLEWRGGCSDERSDTDA